MLATKKQHGVSAKKWTAAEYERLTDAGLLDGYRVELIEGVIVKMAARKESHIASVHLTADSLRAAFGSGYYVRSQDTLHLGKRSEPEPDVAVVTGGPRDYAAHPTTALLVVEVGDTTLRFDRGPKGSLYAKAGILDYWIVNLTARQLEIRRNPFPDPTQRCGYGYRDLTILTDKDFVTPLAAPQARIAVADMLP